MFFIIGIVCFIASFLGTISGFGISILMIPSLLFFMPYKQTLFIVGVIHLVNSIWKILLFRKGVSWRLFFLFGTPAIITSLFGALFVGSGGKILVPILGVFLILYSLFLFIKPSFYIPATNNTLIFGGSIVGFSAGIFGMRGAIRSMFLSAFNVPKEIYLGTTGAISFIVDIARLYVYWQQGVAFEPTMYWVIVVFILVSFVGAYFGRMIVEKISQQKFRVIVAFFLLLMGIRLFLNLLL